MGPVCCSAWIYAGCAARALRPGAAPSTEGLSMRHVLRPCGTSQCSLKILVQCNPGFRFMRSTSIGKPLEHAEAKNGLRTNGW